MSSKPPQGTYKKPYLNLDALFGHVFTNVIGEPITPTNIAIFYLLRIVFQTHFGFLHNRSEYEMLTTEQKCLVFQWFYALMSLEQELTYTGFRRFMRTSFGAFKNISINFFARMEAIESGAADVNYGIEDEFYTNKHPKISRYLRNDPAQEILDILSKDDLQFSSSYSFMYRWLKRFLAQASKCTKTDYDEINTSMRYWIQDAYEENFYEFHFGTDTPFEVNSAIRSRDWVGQNLHWIQKDPRYAQRPETLIGSARVIQEYQPDATQSHLLEALTYIQLRDCPLAIRSIKAFFDASAFELNNNIKHAMKTFRLGIPSQTPLLYAPILQARICRLFGDYQTARRLLTESLQQAQLRGDEICHQMGNTEMHTLDIVQSGGILEDKVGKNHENLVNKDPRISRKALKHINDLHGHSRAGPCCEYTEEDFELAAEMDSYGKQLMILKEISEGVYKLKYDRYAETGLACPVGYDLNDRDARVTSYGHAVMCSNLIRNGMYKQARTSGIEMTIGNFGSPFEPRYQTEPYAVIQANVAYSFAAVGNFRKAFQVITEMRYSFPEEVNWQAFRHVTICESIIKFDEAFLRHKWSFCKKYLRELKDHSETEYDFRRALLLFAIGRETESLDLLRNMKSVDVRVKMRRHLALASLLTKLGHYEKTDKQLYDAMELAATTNIQDIVPMIKRRHATCLLRRGKAAQALALCKEIKTDIEGSATCMEKACLYMTAAQSANEIKQDPRFWIAKAQNLFPVGNVNGQWPTLIKDSYIELAKVHASNGIEPNRDLLARIGHSFSFIHDVYPEHCTWELL